MSRRRQQHLWAVPPLRRRGGTVVGLIVALLASPVAGRQQRPLDTVFLDARAFDEPVLLEIAPFGEQADHRDALIAALAEIQEIEALTDPDGERSDGVGALNRAAGESPVAIDPRVAELIERSLAFCRWSQGAHGPLGGNLNGLWGIRAPVYARPDPELLRAETQKADCDRLAVEEGSRSRAQLSSGSRVDLWGFARGFAVDRAVAILKQEGATEGWVEIGTVTRAFGSGRDGEGWPASANPTGAEGLDERVLLLDRALAMVSSGHRPIEIAGDRYPRLIDQRHGRPPEEMLAVLVVTELAVDAQALASALFVLDQRQGEYRLGLLQPAPAVLWMMGSGEGRPLLVSKGWAGLPKWSP